MPFGLPARMTLVCVLLIAAQTARADRRKVAVVDLSGDPVAHELRKALYNELLGHWTLQPLGDAQRDAALQGVPRDEDVAPIDAAKLKKEHADDSLDRYDAVNAENEASDGLTGLLVVVPNATSIALAADLAVARGVANLARRKPADAAVAFALAHRLNPMKELDPARYLPEIRDAFNDAFKIAPAKTSVEIKGTGRAWIDGKDVGQAPGVFETTVGSHLVQLTGPDRETRGVYATTPASAPIEIADAPASVEIRIERARLVLARAPDEAARAAAMKQLADLLDVHDAVLISKNADDKLVIQTWRDLPPDECKVNPHCGFSKFRIHTDEKPIDILEPALSPPKPEPQIPIPFIPIKPEPEPPWYQKRWVQASVAGGVLAVVVGSLLIARQDHFIDWGNRDIKTGM
jgi:hypothetical protein